MEPISPEKVYNATVQRVKFLTPYLFQFWIQPDSGVPDFLPGQYVALGVVSEETQKLVKRAYSIASSPETRDSLEFALSSISEGLLSPRLAELKVGSRLFVQNKIVGTFVTSAVPDGKRLLLCATGTGIAPYLSLLRTRAECARFSEIVLLHGVRTEQELLCREELVALQQEAPFRYLAAVSRQERALSGDERAPLREGYLQQYFEDDTVRLSTERDHLFLCGNPAMIHDMSARALVVGFREHTKKQEGNLHFERYW